MENRTLLMDKTMCLIERFSVSIQWITAQEAAVSISSFTLCPVALKPQRQHSIRKASVAKPHPTTAIGTCCLNRPPLPASLTPHFCPHSSLVSSALPINMQVAALLTAPALLPFPCGPPPQTLICAIIQGNQHGNDFNTWPPIWLPSSVPAPKSSCLPHFPFEDL